MSFAIFVSSQSIEIKSYEEGEKLLIGAAKNRDWDLTGQQYTAILNYQAFLKKHATSQQINSHCLLISKGLIETAAADTPQQGLYANFSNNAINLFGLEIVENCLDVVEKSLIQNRNAENQQPTNLSCNKLRLGG